MVGMAPCTQMGIHISPHGWAALPPGGSSHRKGVHSPLLPVNANTGDPE